MVHASTTCRAWILFLEHVSEFWRILLAYETPQLVTEISNWSMEHPQAFVYSLWPMVHASTTCRALILLLQHVSVFQRIPLADEITNWSLHPLIFYLIHGPCFQSLWGMLNNSGPCVQDGSHPSGLCDTLTVSAISIWSLEHPNSPWAVFTVCIE